MHNISDYSISIHWWWKLALLVMLPQEFCASEKLGYRKEPSLGSFTREWSWELLSSTQLFRLSCCTWSHVTRRPPAFLQRVHVSRASYLTDKDICCFKVSSVHFRWFTRNRFYFNADFLAFFCNIHGFMIYFYACNYSNFHKLQCNREAMIKLNLMQPVGFFIVYNSYFSDLKH